MKTNAWMCGLALWLGGLAPCWAQTNAPPPDYSAVEAFLRQSRVEHEKGTTNKARAVLAQLTALLGQNTSLVEAYKYAYANVNFEGAERDQAKLAAWEKDNKNIFKEEPFQWAVRAHVQYLAATMHKAMGDDDSAVRMTLTWIDGFPRSAERYDQCTRYPVIKTGMAGSVFLKGGFRPTDARQTTLGTRKPAPNTDLLQNLSDWYLGDLSNLPEVHRINVIGCLRTRHDPRIFQEWQRNISLEAEAAERSGLLLQREEFALNRRPWLLWQTGKDYQLFKQPRRALEMMMQAIRESPRCKDYDAIAENMQTIIDTEREAGNAPAPASTNAPAAEPSP